MTAGLYSRESGTIPMMIYHSSDDRPMLAVPIVPFVPMELGFGPKSAST